MTLVAYGRALFKYRFHKGKIKNKSLFIWNTKALTTTVSSSQWMKGYPSGGFKGGFADETQTERPSVVSSLARRDAEENIGTNNSCGSHCWSGGGGWFGVTVSSWWCTLMLQLPNDEREEFCISATLSTARARPDFSLFGKECRFFVLLSLAQLAVVQMHREDQPMMVMDCGKWITPGHEETGKVEECVGYTDSDKLIPLFSTWHNKHAPVFVFLRRAMAHMGCAEIPSLARSETIVNSMTRSPHSQRRTFVPAPTGSWLPPPSEWRIEV